MTVRSALPVGRASPGPGGGEAGRAQRRVHAPPPSPSAAVPFSTWTRICCGRHVDQHAPPLAAGAVRRGERLVLAQRVEEPPRLRRVPLQRRADALARRSPVSPTGTEANSDDAGEKPRIARARSISSSVPKPWSARTEPSTARVDVAELHRVQQDAAAGGPVDQRGQEALLALHPAQVGGAVDVPGADVLQGLAAVRASWCRPGRSRPV